MSYYQRHVFFCLNQRTNGEASCGDHDAQGAFDHCKSRVSDIDEIVERHLRDGEVVERLVLPDAVGR